MAKLWMTPLTGERLLRFVGDTVEFALHAPAPRDGWQARLRTNLGRAALIREEIIQSKFKKLPLAGASWRDIPMRWEDGVWTLSLPLAEVGFFKAKAYAMDAHGYQHWPDGADLGIAVHPDATRTANTIYCAFTRMFGANKTAAFTANEALDAQLRALDKQGYTVIPPSGKLRDVTRELPHIFGALGGRILHLLPVNPTPTTMAKYGRFGSAYACEDLLGIDPALVDYDRRTTGVEQFCELTYEAHRHGGRVFLDIVINHTGWGAWLQENHPEWYLRDDKGNFVSPGAWGTTWEDLTELEHTHAELWEYLAEVFLTWCRRGVDGFRCDAGYKVPMPAWQYISARVRQEFPDTVFLLEGLGGGWGDTEHLLTEGGMQWAYSELFQENSGPQVAGYLDHALKQSQRVGVLVHYSETHDNNRLAARSPAWSLLRNRLSALTSVNGGYGFTCGVEWLAAEKINVHSNRGMNWGNAENILPELAQLNHLLAQHPCFFDGAKLTRLSAINSPIYALRRDSAEGEDTVFVLANNDLERTHKLTFEATLSELRVDLLGQSLPYFTHHGDEIIFTLPPAACFCLAENPTPRGLAGDAYRRARAQAAWAVNALSRVLPSEEIFAFDWHSLAAAVEQSPFHFLAAITHLGASPRSADLTETLRTLERANHYPQVVRWSPTDVRRVTLVPPHHWLLIEDSVRFRATLKLGEGSLPQHAEAIAVRCGYVVCFPPQKNSTDAQLTLERYAETERTLSAEIRFLNATPSITTAVSTDEQALVLLTNGRGGMARMSRDLGHITSKYDCVLGANLHPTLPVDRHVFAKRIRAWLNADGFITPLNGDNLVEFVAGPPARWRFVANAGDGRSVVIDLTAEMIEGQNTTLLCFTRPAIPPPLGEPLPEHCAVSLTVRVDIEDRNFHSETKRNPGAEHHFATHCRALNFAAAHSPRIGFAFTPAIDRQLHVVADSGAYHHESEWCENIPHPVEQSRRQTGSGDAFSPGWFELPLANNASATLAVTAELAEISNFKFQISNPVSTSSNDSKTFTHTLTHAARAFVVRRDDARTVIAGYPWFLDWGRDTLICARGLLAGNMIAEVQQLLVTFGRFEANGTLPNTIHGADASNRDTTDAPLWYAVVCEELAAAQNLKFEISNLKSQISNLKSPIYSTPVDAHGRTIADVLRSIATGYMRGTPNGIRMDAASGLIWSPSHFTWMDTNYPAGTPREGYPVEIQVLWIRLLRQLARLPAAPEEPAWDELATRAEKSFQALFWLEEPGWFADVLLAKSGEPAAHATRDQALRSNCLFAISLGLVTGERAQRCVAAALQYLVVPGALRTLAPLPVTPPLPIYGNSGQLLNDPAQPYFGTYAGDEDTQRKPAYHNGTAWTWTFPVFCEALACAWTNSPEAVVAARAYLGSMDRLLAVGCLGHLPEIVDGDAPHTPRGCDAQAWGATEALRVWHLFSHTH